MKKLILTLLIVCIPSISFAEYDASILINTDTQKILYNKNPNKKVYPASLTKLMTLYITFEALDKGVVRLNQKLIISKEAARQPASKIGLIQGDKISVEDAIKTLIVKSANDVATVLSENISGEEKDFAKLMTNVAKQIGMADTKFKNASGLTNYEQITTVKDMAMLGLAILKYYPKYYHYFNIREIKYKGKIIRTHNNILYKHPFADGIKTGYTSASGYNLIASAKNEKGVRILGVIVGESNPYKRDDEMVKLLDYGFYKSVNNVYNNLSFNDWKNNKTPKFNYQKPTISGSEITVVKSEPKRIEQSKNPVEIEKNQGLVKNQQPFKFAKKSDKNKNIKYDYIVQTGAFYRKVEAEKHIIKVNKNIEKSYNHKNRIDKVFKNGTDFFRAQILVADKPSANILCQKFKQQNTTDCFVKKNDKDF